MKKLLSFAAVGLTLSFAIATGVEARGSNGGGRGYGGGRSASFHAAHGVHRGRNFHGGFADRGYRGGFRHYGYRSYRGYGYYGLRYYDGGPAGGILATGAVLGLVGAAIAGAAAGY